MLSKKQQNFKRIFDIVLSFFGLLVFGLPILILMLFSSLSTRKSGLFGQERVGENGVLFTIFKIRTMNLDNRNDFITLANDERTTRFGSFLRKTKLDELPQLYNVLIGHMSFVGPRPDVVGYADALIGDDRVILSVKPGITGAATLKYRNEEKLLSTQADPKKYNDEIIWPDKVKMNKKYIKNWSFLGDLKLIYLTFFN